MFYFIIGVIVFLFLFSIIYVLVHVVLSETARAKKGRAAKQMLVILKRHPEAARAIRPCLYRNGDINMSNLWPLWDLLKELQEDDSLLSCLSESERAEFMSLWEVYRTASKKSAKYSSNMDTFTNSSTQTAGKVPGNTAGSTAGKDAAKQVDKGAVIGAVIAGDAGAVVGATAAKAKLDAERESKTEQK